MEKQVDNDIETSVFSWFVGFEVFGAPGFIMGSPTTPRCTTSPRFPLDCLNYPELTLTKGESRRVV